MWHQYKIIENRISRISCGYYIGAEIRENRIQRWREWEFKIATKTKRRVNEEKTLVRLKP